MRTATGLTLPRISSKDAPAVRYYTLSPKIGSNDSTTSPVLYLLLQLLETALKCVKVLVCVLPPFPVWGS